MKTISKEIAASKPGSENTWEAGEIVFDVTDLSNVEYNSAKDQLQYGASTLWRNKGGLPDDGKYGRFIVKDGVFSFNPEYRIGERSSKKQEQIALAIEEELRRAARFQLALEDWETVELSEITEALPEAQIKAIREGIVERFK